jgi:hypothetical protein
MIATTKKAALPFLVYIGQFDNLKNNPNYA